MSDPLQLSVRIAIVFGSSVATTLRSEARDETRAAAVPDSDRRVLPAG